MAWTRSHFTGDYGKSGGGDHFPMDCWVKSGAVCSNTISPRSWREIYIKFTSEEYGMGRVINLTASPTLFFAILRTCFLRQQQHDAVHDTVSEMSRELYIRMSRAVYAKGRRHLVSDMNTWEWIIEWCGALLNRESQRETDAIYILEKIRSCAEQLCSNIFGYHL